VNDLNQEKKQCGNCCHWIVNTTIGYCPKSHSNKVDEDDLCNLHEPKKQAKGLLRRADKKIKEQEELIYYSHQESTDLPERKEELQWLKQVRELIQGHVA